MVWWRSCDSSPKLRSPFDAEQCVPNVGGRGVLRPDRADRCGDSLRLSRAATRQHPIELAPSDVARRQRDQRAERDRRRKGPMLFAGLARPTGERTHRARPRPAMTPQRLGRLLRIPGRSATKLRLSSRYATATVTDRFVDCEGNDHRRERTVTPAEAVNPVVENKRLLSIDLSGRYRASRRRLSA